MSNMTKDSAKQILKSRVLISKPGKYAVKVTNVHTFIPADGSPREIVNVAAMNPYQLETAIALMKNGDYQAATNQGMSHSPLPGKYVPVKGEVVYVVVEEQTTKAGIKGMFITSLTPMEVSNAAKVSFNFDDEESTNTSDDDTSKINSAETAEIVAETVEETFQ